MKLILLCSTLFSKDDAIANPLSKMLEKRVKENQAALSESKKKKKRKAMISLAKENNFQVTSNS